MRASSRWPVLLFAAAVIAAAPFGCGSSGKTSGATGSGGSGAATSSSSAGGSGGSGTGGSATGGGGTGGAATCASGILCGDLGTCCAVGATCVQGACAAACPSGIRCAGACCAAGQVCVNAACATPTGTCDDSVDCAASEYCEPTLHQCLPQPKGNVCSLKPPAGPLSPKLKWTWPPTGQAPMAVPSSDQAISAPLVVDVVKNAMHSPAVFFTSSPLSGGGTPFAIGYLRRLDGKTGAEVWDATTDALSGANPIEATFAPAVADIDGDGVVDIVAMGANGQIVAFDGNGKLKWRSTHKDTSPYVFPLDAIAPNPNSPPPGSLYSSTIAVADMNHDGKAEIVMSGVVFDSNGVAVSSTGNGNVLAGGTGSGTSTIVADVDGDGLLDLVTGNLAMKWDGSSFIWQNAGAPDGFPAIADLDLDGKPELVVATGSDLRVLDAATGTLRASIALVAGGPGSPVIADFAGTGTPEIGVQTGASPCQITLYDFDGKNLTQKWSTPLTVCSGSLTATAFDFNGDGIAEVLAHDDCRINVLEGTDGSLLLSLPASHATWTEFVSVVDVDADGHADLLYSSNDTALTPAGWNTYCHYQGSEAPTHGIFVYNDAQNDWVATRKVWNEQPYHITNIKSDGSLPEPELPSWGASGWNDYRVSAQGKGALNAPDLVVSLGADLSGCPGMIELQALVENQGSAGVPAGVVVAFYAGTPPSGMLLGMQSTTQALLPGASETLTLSAPAPAQASPYYVVVDPGMMVSECVTTNDTGTIAGVGCSAAK